MTAIPQRVQRAQPPMMSDDDPARAGWLDTEQRVRHIREHIGRFHLRVMQDTLATAVGAHPTQYSRMEGGVRAWTIPVFAPVAGCLLGTLELITHQPWPLHLFFPEYRPESTPALTLPQPEPLALSAPSLPTARPEPPFTWQIPAILNRLSAHEGRPWKLRTLAAAITAAEGQPEQIRGVQNTLDRLNTGRTAGSLPTLFRLYRFLAPRLSTPESPFTLDDILNIPRWSLPPSALIRSPAMG